MPQLDPPVWKDGCVSIEIEIPNFLYAKVKDFCDSNSDWDWNRFFCAAIALLLLQKGDRSKQIQKFYLNLQLEKLKEGGEENAQ